MKEHALMIIYQKESNSTFHQFKYLYSTLNLYFNYDYDYTMFNYTYYFDFNESKFNFKKFHHKTVLCFLELCYNLLNHFDYYSLY